VRPSRFALLLFFVFIPGTIRAQVPAKNPYGKLPLRFEKNQGQTDSQVQFLARGGGYTLFLTPTEAVFVLRPSPPNQPEFLRRGKRDRRKLQTPRRNKASVLRMKLSGGSASSFEGANRLPGTVNYLIGRNPAKWYTAIPAFSSVQVSAVYPGIDMVYYGNERQLEYDFVVKPGADPTKIAFEFEGADGMSLGETGEVRVDSAAGRLTIRKPSIYQMEKGVRKPVDGKFVMRDGRSVGVELNSYDHAKSLVIDPVLAYSTYLGGSDQDLADGIAVDTQGNAYVAGYTASVDFPTIGASLSAPPNGTAVAFVSKLNQTGTGFFYSTYLGGTTQDVATGIAVDSNGQAYVVGATSDIDFPVTTGNAFQVTYESTATANAFLAKLSADGQSLLYSTYLGGGASDVCMGVVVDGNQNAYLTGSASSSDFPITTANAFQISLNSANGNAFVSRIDTTRSGANSLIYSTFLGGSLPYAYGQLQSGNFGGDAGIGIAVDSNQNVYVAGQASSIDFPITASTAYQTSGNPANSAFLAKLNTNQSGGGSLIYSTFLGGTGSVGDLAYGIALDSSSNPYLVGNASSIDFPTTTGAANNGSSKAFVAKFNATLSGSASLIYATLVGGSVYDLGSTIAVDANGDASIAGGTYSPDFPVTSGALQSTIPNTSTSSGYIATLSPDGTSLIYGTYFGGSGTTFGDYVNALTTDTQTNIYFTGQTDSSDIPTTQGVLQSSLNGQLNGFVGKLAALVTPTISALSPSSGTVGTSVTITGQDFGEVQAGAVTFNGVPASPTVWSPNSIQVPVPSGANTGNVVVAVGNLPSNGVMFTVSNAAPTIFSANPNAAPVASQIQISGSNFGTPQQTSAVLFNSVAASPSSWTNSTIVVPVPQGATTGTLTVQVGGVTSNAVDFAVANPPAITATVLPTPNSAGWNNSAVTVTFACTAGDNPLASCPSPQRVSTAGTGQVVTGTVVDTAGLSASASVTLNIEKIPPAILGASPADQSVLTTATGSITGKVVNSLTSVIGVTCNGTAASFNSGAFSCNFSLNPGVNLVMVLATDVAGNMAGSPLHLIYSAPLPSPTSLQITPANANVLVGTTQQFTAVDQLGNPRTDATWTVDNTNVATISTDSSPILTGVASGSVTLTASVGGVSAQIQVNIISAAALPVGTVQWTAPPLSGFSAASLALAVPTPNGPNIYAIGSDNNGNWLVQASTKDGQQMWQHLQQLGLYGAPVLVQAVPDSSGGLVLFFCYQGLSQNDCELVDLDGQTGQVAWKYVSPTGFTRSSVAVRQDGALLTTEYDPVTDHDSLVAFNGATGQRTPLFDLTSSTSGYTYGPTTIDANGTAYLLLADETTQNIALLTASLDGSVSTQQVVAAGCVPFPGEVIPDGQGGQLATWTCYSVGTNTFEVTHVTSQGSNTFVLPLNGDPYGSIYAPHQLVLGENGTAFATDGANAIAPQLATVVSFDINSGQVNWSYQAPSPGSLSIVSSTQNGGLFVQQTSQSGALTTDSFDASGNATPPQPFSTTTIFPYLFGSWIGIMNNAINELADPNAPLPPPGWEMPQGGRHQQSSPQLPVVHTFVPAAYLKNAQGQADPLSPRRFTDSLEQLYAGKAETLGFPFAQATYPAFVEDIKMPIQAFGFIGHSLALGTPPTSVGLCFYIKDPVYLLDCIVQDDYYAGFSQGNNSTIKGEDVVQLKTQATVIFIAACDTQMAFLKLWDINQNTVGRALIVPQSNSLDPVGVDLSWGTTAWEAILTSLLAGNTVTVAVNAGNAAATPKGSQYQWQVIGDGSVKIVQKSN
jgi:hypothetical protein